MSALEFHVWQDVQRCFTFIAGTKREVDEIFEILTRHGYTLDISEEKKYCTNMTIQTPSPFSPPSLNISTSSNNIPRQRTPLWAAMAFNSDSPSASNRSTSQRLMNRLSSSPIIVDFSSQGLDE